MCSYIFRKIICKYYFKHYFQVTGVIVDTRASIDLNSLDTQSILEELSNIS